MSDQRPQYRIGSDWGLVQDSTAVAVVEQKEDRAVLRFIWQYPLNTPYPTIVEHQVNLYHDICKEGDVISWASDATGIGPWPTTLLQEKLGSMNIEAFKFTTESKRSLVGKIKIMHAFGRLRFATKRGDEQYNAMLHDLIAEMKQLRVKMIRGDFSNPEVELFRTGAHDDMFTALALAVKDINFDMSNSPTVLFATDRTWTRTPLDDRNEAPIAFW